MFTGSILFATVSQGTLRFQYSGLYAVSQFDWNGFIIALINWDKRWQNDGCRRHKLSLPGAQFVITIYLFFSSLLSSVFHVVPQLVPICLPAILEGASPNICSVTAGTTAATWATRWSVVSSTWAIFSSPHYYLYYLIYPPLCSFLRE